MNASCTGKTGYLSWDGANKALRRHRFHSDPRGGQLKIYRCRICAFWHYGTSTRVNT